MSCYFPLPGYVDRDSTGSAVRIGYWAGEQGDKLELPCGHCVGCRLDRSRSWSIRMMHEAQLYDSNLFLTLDYGPTVFVDGERKGLPPSLSLEYPDFQLFMKRLRKEVRGVSPSPSGKYPVRFFCAGEYGEKFQRPHWHAILFNVWFRDQVGFHNGTYRSAQVERLWGHGNVVIDQVTPASAAYVAGYTLGKVYGRAAREAYEDVVDVATGELSSRRPEFCTMSRRPGIGAWWYEKFSGDLFPADHAVQDGKEFKVPRYYSRRFFEDPVSVPELIEDIKYARYLKARAAPLEESSERRRAERAEVARARLRLFSEREH